MSEPQAKQRCRSIEDDVRVFQNTRLKIVWTSSEVDPVSS